MATELTVAEKIKTLGDNVEALGEMVREVNGWNGGLDSYEVHEFDDDFFNTYFEGKPEEAARATHFGEIESWTDEYIRFNGYGNLESLSDYRYEQELLDGKDEIIEQFLELLEEGNVDAEYIIEQHYEEEE